MKIKQKNNLSFLNNSSFYSLILKTGINLKFFTMKKITIISFTFILVTVCFTGQAQKTGLSQFHSIEISSDIDVELILDKTCGIEWTLKNIEPDKLITEIEDQTLKIRTRTGIYRDAEIKAKVYYTELDAIDSKGRASIWSEEDLYLKKISFNIYNGGECRLKVHTDSLFASVTEGSILYLKGETAFLDVKVGTGATFSGYDLESDEAVVLANSGGKAKIAVKQYLKATANSKGFIGYIGEPEKVKKESRLGGEIIQTVRAEE